MNVEDLMTDERMVARLTVAINSVVAQQVVDGRAMKPWIYEDTRRMLGIAWYLDLPPLAAGQQQGDHYALVSDVQAPANPKLEAVSKALSDQSSKKKTAIAA